MERWILRQRQGLPLQVKVELTKLRIRQWYEHYDSDCYFSFSGGKQSTILLAIIRMMYSDIPGVFVDTGLEFPGVRRFVRFMQHHIFHWAEEGETIKDISQRYNVAVDDILDSNSSRDIKFTANTRFKMKFPVYVPKLNGGNIVILKPDTSFRETIQKYGYAVGTKKVSQTIYKLRHHNFRIGTETTCSMGMIEGMLESSQNVISTFWTHLLKLVVCAAMNERRNIL
ncbi:MAG: phosphoadenosine phosphosulfate reductase family protein [Clostridia bacterium]|nr:phosphoadenosine phosphosulfate reductase family protein [Clostridia bacterium]